MRLPGCEKAVIPEGKVKNYLLNSEHEDGKTKAKFFLDMGFDADSLTVALLQHATSCEAVKTEETEFGAKYRVEGELPTPTGETPTVLSAWIIREGEDFPQLTSAYPQKRKRS